MVCRMLGFKDEGTKRRAIYKNGDFRDIFTHSILKSEFLLSKIYERK